MIRAKCGRQNGGFSYIAARLANAMFANEIIFGDGYFMKATGIVRRIDDLGRVVIPKEIRRTMRIREGDPLQMTLTNAEIFTVSVVKLAKRKGWQ